MASSASGTEGYSMMLPSERGCESASMRRAAETAGGGNAPLAGKVAVEVGVADGSALTAEVLEVLREATGRRGTKGAAEESARAGTSGPGPGARGRGCQVLGPRCAERGDCRQGGCGSARGGRRRETGTRSPASRDADAVGRHGRIGQDGREKRPAMMPSSASTSSDVRRTSRPVAQDPSLPLRAAALGLRPGPRPSRDEDPRPRPAQANGRPASGFRPAAVSGSSTRDRFVHREEGGGKREGIRPLRAIRRGGGR